MEKYYYLFNVNSMQCMLRLQKVSHKLTKGHEIYVIK